QGSGTGEPCRLGSLVTEVCPGDHPLVKEKELCLHRREKHCLMCVQRCPVGGIDLSVKSSSGGDLRK
ncbi:MAG: hypothetical protein ACNA7H_09950, partial [Desulfotignum sp.]